jgi:hypothetical protein
MLPVLRQQLPSNLLAQLLQHIQMLVELLGTAANANLFILSRNQVPTALVSIFKWTEIRQAMHITLG